MHQFTTLVSSGCCCTSCQWKGHFWTPTSSTLLQFLPAVHWYRILPLGMVSSVDLVHLLMLQVIKEAYKLVLVSPPFQILTFLTCFVSWHVRHDFTIQGASSYSYLFIKNTHRTFATLCLLQFSFLLRVLLEQTTFQFEDVCVDLQSTLCL